MSSYDDFVAAKSQIGMMSGFDPVLMPDFLFDFQRSLTTWAIQKGRAAIFADCGLGKTPMQLVWAENVVRKTNGNVLILTPLAVSYQVCEEATKFGIQVKRSTDGTIPNGTNIVVTNYERADRFKPDDFEGIVCDESSILKNFDGVRRATITELMRTRRYRLLCTATAAPNDYIELGTSSEALGELGHMDMLTRFFRNVDGTASHRTLHRSRTHHVEPGQQWRFKGHAEQHFWQWVCSWARAARRPSDLGFDDGKFKLPPLNELEHTVAARTHRPDMLFDLQAVGLKEQRDERRRTITERCEKVAELVSHKKQALVWCHLNDESEQLGQMIKDAEEVSGSDNDDDKEAKLSAFAHGDLRVLVTKPKIGAWGLNLQRCAHVTFFPSHSYEQYYQGVRRCWRFGQKHPVRVDIVSTDGESDVLKNLRRKSERADRMFSALVAEMNNTMKIDRGTYVPSKIEAPTWLSM